jgi:SPP1 family predicted phage head-tail adaptor
MEIGALRTRITIQKNETVVDRYGNHIPAWQDYFSCWATCSTSGRSADETNKAGSTQEDDRLDITVRWCPEIAAVNSKQYRVLVNGCPYNILGIDEMGYRRNSRKLFCQRTER